MPPEAVLGFFILAVSRFVYAANVCRPEIGLATQFMRDCILRAAKDLDKSGAINIVEIRHFAQEKINNRMANDANYKPHHLVLNGNAAFVPAWFSQAALNPGTNALAAFACTTDRNPNLEHDLTDLD